MNLPVIIQGGMGAGVSHWVLAKAVSKLGQLGVVSGTALDTVMARRLQLGDPGGHLRRALDHFPMPEIAQRIYDNYFVPCGKAINRAFKRIPMYSLNPSRALLEMTVVSNFIEVFLAKEGHKGPVGINYLEKIQMPNLASIYGAMLAGVDYILMGAGIPREIPGVLDKYVNHEEATLKISVADSGAGDDFRMRFNPEKVIGPIGHPLKRPSFLAIIASVTLAISLMRKSTGHVDGFVIEGPTAGGHNAPPRGPLQLNENGEPIYGERDEVDLDKIKELGLPYWLAGSYGDPGKVREALDQGAAGVQIGTPFALCEESGLKPEIKQSILQKIAEGSARVFTDPLASPTGFPFKVVLLEDSLTNPELYAQRPRICDLGYLRTPYKTGDGRVQYRCPSEPVEDYLRKSGRAEDTVGRKCLCNALMANIGLGQVQRSGYVEKPLVTTGQELSLVQRFLQNGNLSYSAADVIQALCPQLEFAAACA
ncbi:MAG TPA: nitronate monooxygenase [bacterium]|nr:nitronate monooxygenase [Candidatus Omnitrophota bacterium]HOJ62249.1 nitronate monooxygenase [bacterium]HOL94713.1 nitronate monooxygenase [bacterium]HPP00568.1 nitronate monooxygenase [bacterium]